MFVLGYLGAVFIGVVLGLIGSGGSILTVPILVYVMTVNPVLATAYSLFVVGTTALFGAIKNMKSGLVDFKIAINFFIPALISVYLTRRYIIPNIPEQLFNIEEFIVTKNTVIMLFFALLMIVASIAMIVSETPKNENKEIEKGSEKGAVKQQVFIITEGLVVGLLTGLVGAGGGFLIIPVLVLFVKLPFKNAVATSLVIVAVKSLIGFLGDVQNLSIDWTFLLSFTAFAVLGIGIGIYLNRFIDGKKLKKSFGFFVLIMAFYVIFKELS